VRVDEGAFQAVSCSAPGVGITQIELWVLLWSLFYCILRTAVDLLRPGTLCFSAPGWLRLLFLPWARYLRQLTGCFSLPSSQSSPGWQRKLAAILRNKGMLRVCKENPCSLRKNSILPAAKLLAGCGKWQQSLCTQASDRCPSVTASLGRCPETQFPSTSGLGLSAPNRFQQV